MRTAAIAGEGGSAGKTTTTVTTAALEGGQGRRVLVIDMDPQANATDLLNVDPDGPEIGDVLLRSARLDEAIVETGTPGVWCVPSSRRLSQQVQQLNGVHGPEQRLRLALKQLPADQFDLVLIDCPGTMSLLTVMAMLVADSLVTTTLPSRKEIKGIAELQTTLDETTDVFDLDVRLDAIVPCAVSGKGRLYAEAVDYLRQEYPGLVTTSVRDSVRVRDADSNRTPLPIWAPSADVTNDYRQVHVDLIRMGVLR